jgi:hypothetical protein
MDAEALRAHCEYVSKRIELGKVTPWLGAGANLCGRPPNVDWHDGHLPSGRELAEHLARDLPDDWVGNLEQDVPPELAAMYPGLQRRIGDLVRIALYVELHGGDAVLFDELHRLFAGKYEPTTLHCLLADIPVALRGRNSDSPCQLIVTTNYDDMLERAFTETGQTFDVVYYSAARDRPGRFMHLAPDGKRTPATKRYSNFALGERTVILKLHGAVDRGDEHGDSYVITEDHYIDYVALTNIYALIPAALMRKMSESHFLFLGYAMRDWNLRVILHRIWANQPREFKSWAIQKEPDPIETKLWGRKGVEIIPEALEDWVDVMRRFLQ